MPRTFGHDSVDIDGMRTGGDRLRYLGDARSSNSKTYTYSFALIDSRYMASTLQEVKLYLNPQSIQMNEPAATTIAALQNGGKYIERRGNIFKDITIAGTTGYMPYKRAHSVFRGIDQFNQSFRFDDEEEIAKQLFDEAGFTRFHELRNFFREYQNRMRVGDADDTNGKIFMAWLNFKDDEFFVVEPMAFSLARDRSKPLTYDYSIQLRFIDTLDRKLIPKDPAGVTGNALSALQKGLAVIAKIQKIINRAIRALNALKAIVNTVVAAVRAIVNAAIGLVTNLISAMESFTSGITSAILSPIGLVKDVFRSFGTVLETAASVGQHLVTDTVDAITDGIQAFHELGAETSLFAKPFDQARAASIARFNTAAGIRGVDTPALSDATGTTEETVLPNESIQQFAARVLGDVARWFEIVVLNDLRSPYTSPKASERAPNTIVPGDSIKVPASPNSGTEQSSATAGTPPTGPASGAPSVVGQAASGSPNDLEADLSTVSEPFRPGQWVGFICEFLSGTGKGQIALIVSNTESLVTFQEPVAIAADTTTIYAIREVGKPSDIASLQVLGVDLALTSNYDIGKTAAGGLQTIRGFDNMFQAVGIKFRTEQGTLITHPYFGIQFPIGNRARGDALSQHRLNARRTLLSDPRIGAIRRLNFTAIRDTLTTEGEIELKFSGITLPVGGTT